MKKKLKDITFEEYLKTCLKKTDCHECPFWEYCGCNLNAMDNIEDDLDKEIDL